ncbi:MAG: ABC transporter substrate-binding protein, partial [Chloroflexi bacterium]|nr:ABC transporter substrate-binding protein [Chloroflexota bacterium]
SGSPAQVYARIVNVTQAYFDFINETQGGVHGRTINLLVKDDEYTPSKTNTVVRELVEQDGVFAILSGLGTATHLTIVDYLLGQGVPDMYMSTGALEWVKDPAARPNVFGAIPNYVAEGMVLGQYISETYPGMKLGIIFQNDEFGEDGVVGIKRGLSDDIEIVAEESYEVTDPDINSQIDLTRSAGADVVIIYALPSHVPTAVRHARQDLDWDVPFVITGVSANEITINLAGEGVMDGTVSISIFHQASEVEHPGIIGHLELLADYTDGFGANFLTIYGQYIGELMVETLERAGPELTREGLIAAAESITDFVCAVCLFSVNLSGTDHDSAQALMLNRVEDGKWVNFGDLISWEGVLPGDLTLDDLVTSPSPYE